MKKNNLRTKNNNKSQRQLQIGEQTKRILAEIFSQDNLLAKKNVYITILRADVSPDAKNARIFIDIFGQFDQKKIMKDLKDATSYLRSKLANKINLRYTPELTFILDETHKIASKIDNLLMQESQKISSKINNLLTQESQEIANKSNSIHLQNFPDTNFLSDEQDLVADMDMVRQVCRAALFVRDNHNLRVRLPLNQLKIIGKNAFKMSQYRDIIADEVNIKNIETSPEIGNLAELKLQLNFKKIGERLGNKMKEITFATKNNNWQKVENDKIQIAGELLNSDEFEIKLITKNQSNIAVLPSNDCLIELDITVSKELEAEGLARDIVRAIQQNRKDANFDVSDYIKIAVFSTKKQVIEVILDHKNYIKEQTLANEIVIDEFGLEQKYPHNFVNKIDDIDLKISLKISV
jgi:ribosome-binding factor A